MYLREDGITCVGAEQGPHTPQPICGRYLVSFFLMIRRALRSTLFPYTTVIRSPGEIILHSAVQTVPLCGLFCGSQFKPDRKSTRLNSSHLVISYAVFCLKKK